VLAFVPFRDGKPRQRKDRQAERSGVRLRDALLGVAHITATL
jgi:hypothetical protein